LIERWDKTSFLKQSLALIAVARKLLVLANALIRDMVPYRAPANSVC
jgi:hypothetical protein